MKILRYAHVLINSQPAHDCHRPYSTHRKFPDLLYFPHLFRWLSTKIKLKYLQKTWDPEFTEGAFIYGSTRAICRITEIINENKPEGLTHLLTDYARSNLRSDMEVKLTKMQKDIIRLTPRDIKLFVPMKVQLVKPDNHNKFVVVLLKSLSMKWYEGRTSPKLVLIVLETEFRRNYAQGAFPEWTISLFDVVQCVLIGGNSTKI